MKKISLKLISITLTIIVTLQCNVVLAATTSALQNEKDSNNQEINNAQTELKEVQGKKSKAVSEVAELDSKITAYETEIDELDEKIDDLSSDITEGEEEIKKLEAEAEQIEKLLAERLVIMYEDGNVSYVDFLLSSESLTDFLSKYYMVTELASYDTDLLEKTSEKKKAVVAEKEKLEASKQELETSKSQKEKTQVELETAKKEKSKQVAELTGDEKKIQAHIDQLKEDNKAIDAQIAAVQAKIQEQLRKQKLQQQQQQQQQSNTQSNKNTNLNNTTNSENNNTNNNSNSTSSTSSSGFIRPVTGYSVTTGWYYSSGALHGAVDFSGSGISGKPVLAVADGIVVTTASLSTSYGNYIIIAHYNGLYTLYAHGQAGSIAVSQGQSVTQGQQIMRVGSTGNSSGPHLHFEVRTSPGKYANRVNPLKYLP